MSARSRDLPRRSCLSTPGSNEKFLAKAPTVPADMTFLDLEDAVAPLEKESARPKVVDAIKNLAWDDRVLCVRVNAWDTEWTYADVIEVVGNAGERLDEVMLPKVQAASDVVALDLLLTQVEKKSGLPVSRRRSKRPVASSTSTRSVPRHPAWKRSSSGRPTSPPASRCPCSRAGSKYPSTRATISTMSSAGS
jgi:citrate lyase beta subunit